MLSSRRNTAAIRVDTVLIAVLSEPSSSFERSGIWWPKYPRAICSQPYWVEPTRRVNERINTPTPSALATQVSITPHWPIRRALRDRKSVVEGKRVVVSVDRGCRRTCKKKKHEKNR